MKVSKIPIIIISAISLFLMIGRGASSWVFSNNYSNDISINVKINDFIFITIPQSVEDTSDELLYCLSNPNSNEGKSLTYAKSSEESNRKPSKDWVGNESKNNNTISYLNISLPSSKYTSYIIKYISSTKVEFYGTTDTLSYPPEKSVTVYKYTYTYSNTSWSKSSGIEGTCKTTYYWLAGGDYSASFNTGTFVQK